MKLVGVPEDTLTSEQRAWIEGRKIAQQKQDKYVGIKLAWLIRWMWVLACSSLVALALAVFLDSIEILKVVIVFGVLYFVATLTYVFSLNPFRSKFKKEFPYLKYYLEIEPGIGLYMW